jgi:arsenate reductase
MATNIEKLAEELNAIIAGDERTLAIAVLKEVGIDITSHRSKNVDAFAGQNFDYVLTVCDNAKES